MPTEQGMEYYEPPMSCLQCRKHIAKVCLACASNAAAEISRLTGEIERLRGIFQAIDESYSGGPSSRAEHMMAVYGLVQKALSGNDAGGEW